MISLCHVILFVRLGSGLRVLLLTPGEGVHGDVQATALQVESQILCDGVAQLRLLLRVEGAFQHGGVRRRSLLSDGPDERQQPLPCLQQPWH